MPETQYIPLDDHSGQRCFWWRTLTGLEKKLIFLSVALAIVVFSLSIVMASRAVEEATTTVAPPTIPTEPTKPTTEPTTAPPTEKPTIPPTEKPTVPPPTEKPTVPPPTEKPTVPTTEKPTIPKTEKTTETTTANPTTKSGNIAATESNIRANQGQSVRRRILAGKADDGANLAAMKNNSGMQDFRTNLPRHHHQPSKRPLANLTDHSNHNHTQESHNNHPVMAIMKTSAAGILIFGIFLIVFSTLMIYYLFSYK